MELSLVIKNEVVEIPLKWMGLKRIEQVNWANCRKTATVHFLSLVIPKFYMDIQGHVCIYDLKAEVKLPKGTQDQQEGREPKKKKGKRIWRGIYSWHMCKCLKFQSPIDSPFNSLIRVTVSWKLLCCYTAQETFSPGYLFKCLGDPMGINCLPWQLPEAAKPASQTFKGLCHPWGEEVGSRDTELRIPVALKNEKQ